MTFRDLHVAFAWFVMVSNGVAGFWALAAHKLPTFRHRSLWQFTGIAQVAVAVQVILGVATLRLDGIDVQRMHMFYGFVALASVAIIYSYRQQLESHTYLLYGFGGLFLMGLAIRAFFLVGP